MRVTGTAAKGCSACACRTEWPIVTGAAAGLGATYAHAIAREGGRVVVVDVADGEGTVAGIRARGGQAMASRADLSDEAQVQQMVTRVMAECGRIDILVNNAGGAGQEAAESAIDKVDRAHWDTIMAMNLTSTMLCLKHVAPHMRRQGSGKIVNVSSRAARGTAWFGQVTPEYIAAKIGVIGLTRQVAKELGPHGINVNCLVPSFTVSGPALQAAWDNMTAEERDHMLAATPLRRLPAPAELASVVVFLVSDESSYVTGACLDVNGGSLMA